MSFGERSWNPININRDDQLLLFSSQFLIAAISFTASIAAFTSSSVVKAPMLIRTVP